MSDINRLHAKPAFTRLVNSLSSFSILAGVDRATMTANSLGMQLISDRLLDRGKAKMQAIGAIMRRLVHLAFGILKSQQPFDPNYALA